MTNSENAFVLTLVFTSHLRIGCGLQASDGYHLALLRENYWPSGARGGSVDKVRLHEDLTRSEVRVRRRGVRANDEYLFGQNATADHRAAICLGITFLTESRLKVGLARSLARPYC
jgi:hypothetical protein